MGPERLINPKPLTLNPNIGVTKAGSDGAVCNLSLARWNCFDFFCLLLSFTDSLLFFLLLANAIDFSMNSASLIKAWRACGDAVG